MSRVLLALCVSACATTGASLKDEPKWGTPVSAPATETQVMRALADLAHASPGADQHLADLFFLGPALWATLRSIDASLDQLGTPSWAVVPMGDKTKQWQMRSFVDREAVRAIAAHVKLRSVAEAFRVGTARPATLDERQLFYALIAFEIRGQPVTVVEFEGHRLVVFLDKGRITHMDLLSEYHAETAPPKE
jgi:hypothetical protein